MSGGTPKSSYSFNGWQRLRTLCIAMRQTEAKVQKLKEDIETKLKLTQKIRDKRSDIQASQVAIQSLEIQLEWRKAKVRTLSARLSKQRRNFGERDAKLLHFRKSVEENEERLSEMQRDYIAKREKLVWTGAQLCMRRKQLVQDVIFIFPIKEQQFETKVQKQETHTTKSTCPCKQILKISTVHLPDAESYAGHNEIDLSVGLDYVCHALDVLSRIFDIPLKFKLNYFGSRSFVVDTIDPALPSNQTNEPLISRPLKIIASSHSPVASSNSVESSTTVSLTESGIYAPPQLQHSRKESLDDANVLFLTSQEPSSSSTKSKLRPSNSFEFIPAAVASENFSDAANTPTFTTDSWTPDKCIEHNRKILRTCYFNADEFVEEDECRNTKTQNGDIYNSVSILS